ncbi:DUF349 domain-containing protein [Eisenibacter elegans]|jgi:hypothetical protein|uniref:DUF349 domain-containing protein n=1 Tax=Eisenibacter elegans TaxID=997 RepID=UPI00040815F1|nr:DUF349 domain-containing protein [Eisenibacter elegans]
MNTTTDHQFGYIKDDKVFLKGFLTFEDRQIGVVKETAAAALAYFEKRFELAKQKVEELEKLIYSAQNKGSYLMKLVHMRKYLSEFDGLGDFPALFAKLDVLEVELRDLIANNRLKNLDIKKALLEELKEVIKDLESRESIEQVKEIKMKWIKTGAAVETFNDDLEEEFNQTIENYFEERKEVYKARNKEIKDRLRAYKNIIFEAHGLKNSDNFEETFQRFRTLQQTWKTTGKVPHRKATRLWESFKAANEVFFTRYKNFRALQEQFPDQSSEEIKQQIVQKLYGQSITLLEDLSPDATEAAKELLVEWKQLTSTFQQLDPGIVYKFRNNCDKVFEKNYLTRVMKRKYPLFETKLPLEQLSLQIECMRGLIRREEQELSINQERLDKMEQENARQQAQFNAQQARGGYGGYQRRFPQKPPIDRNLRQLASTVHVQRRKLEVKKQILRELEEQLAQ